MIDVLVVVVLVALGALALFGLGLTAANRPPGRPARLAVAAVVALLVVQAAIAAVRVFTGAELAETSTFLIYLVVSVCVLPIATQFATASETRDGAGSETRDGAGSETREGAEAGPGPSRWGGAVIAVGAIATMVAVIRLQGLWNGAL